jgi:hypothetical protein
MDGIFQLLTTQMLGIAANLTLQCNLTNGSNVISTPLVILNLYAGFYLVGNGIPPNTVITGLSGSGTNLLIEMSNAATLSGSQTIAIFDPISNSKVRLSWQTQGAPAFAIDDDVVFIRCIEEAMDYNEIRDQTIVTTVSGQNFKQRVYTRNWNVVFRARGPNSFDTIRLIKSMLLENSPHDTLAALNLYMIPVTSTPIRSPEFFEGQWWEQVDYNANFLEQVTETASIDTVSSVEIIGYDHTGQIFDIKPHL